MLEAIDQLSPEMVDDLDGFNPANNQHGGAEDYPELQISGVPDNEELDEMIQAIASHTPETDSDVLTVNYWSDPNDVTGTYVLILAMAPMASQWRPDD
ncbi:hypothetical protein AAF712_009576 [Marasmius tenuissimus]|uniref:Uncharacterized protein n=1 Tax=Marasmius tenuissimus TaxID=585030 RepID=A0ABR2ZRX4_9AGAR